MGFDLKDSLAVNTLRVLSAESIEKANSGHPGLPLGAAPMAYVLWNKILNVNPKTSRNWTNIDLFYPQDMVLHFFIVCYIYQDMMLV